jgi:SAM-dependent methyltransferase
MSRTYADVDAADDVAAAVAWQDRVDAWPQIDAYKRRTYELVPPDGWVLDVGSGTGHDLAAAERPAFGVDASLAMCRTARARGRNVARADAHALPLPDAMFSGARADRVLAHVVRPEQVLAEMRRVVAPGGTVVAADSDQGSLVIHVPGVRAELVEAVRELRATTGYRNGTLARRLPALFTAMGLTDVTVDAFPLVLVDPADAFGLPSWVSYWHQHFTDADAVDWAAGMERVRAGEPFVYALLYFVVSGIRR